MAQQPASARDQVRNVVPALIELSERVLFGEVWERPGLSKRDRSLITCATLIALGREKQLVGHLQRALDAITLEVEPAPDTPADEAARERKAHEVTQHIKSLIGVTCEVAVKSPGEVPRSEGKAVRVRDLRKGG